MSADENWDEDSDIDDWEFPDEPLGDEEDETVTVDCPNCGATMYEDAPQCPACGEYVSRTTSAWQGRPVWWILLGLAGIIATLFLLLPG